MIKGARVSEKIKSSNTSQTACDRMRVLREEHTTNRVLNEDLEFNTVSGAANFLLGTSCNGYLYWKTKEGIPLKSLK